LFDTHKLNEKGFEEVRVFKSKMGEAVRNVLETIPNGREKALFTTKIEEAMFFATKAIASNPDNHTEVIHY
jgi:NCAIR mutase (PurE)-related protein